VNEFELIRRFFAVQPVSRREVALGIGDDAALLEPPSGMQAVLTTDLLVAGVDFLPGADPVSVGHKALAVNLSDLAAMGAEPAWYLVALVLPRVDESWLAGFCEGLYGLARRYHVALVGGDLSRGAETVIAIQAGGWVPRGEALTRRGAQPGDRLFVTGELGGAGLALRHQRGECHLSVAEAATVADRLERPMPRVLAGQRLRLVATSAIDLSDGLLSDLGHVLAASGVGARVFLERLPLPVVYRERFDELGWDLALAHGDDYELLFTVPQANLERLEALREALDCPITEIGEITAEEGLALIDRDGRLYTPRRAQRGYDHFA
jgi:thiamine-monophosphate kinase